MLDSCTRMATVGVKRLILMFWTDALEHINRQTERQTDRLGERERERERESD